MDNSLFADALRGLKINNIDVKAFTAFLLKEEETKINNTILLKIKKGGIDLLEEYLSLENYVLSDLDFLLFNKKSLSTVDLHNIINKIIVELSTKLILENKACAIIDIDKLLNDNLMGNFINSPFDIMFINHDIKTIYYNRFVSDTYTGDEDNPEYYDYVNCEIDHINQNITSLKEHYIGYNIGFNVVDWTIYEKEDSVDNNSFYISHPMNCKEKNYKYNYYSDFLKLINFNWGKEDFYTYFREIGNQLQKHIDKF